MAKVKFIETDSKPICPHCDNELSVIEKTSKDFFTGAAVYVCPNCKKILGIISDALND